MEKETEPVVTKPMDRGSEIPAREPPISSTSCGTSPSVQLSGARTEQPSSSTNPSDNQVEQQTDLVEKPSESTSTMSLTRKWIESVEAVKEGHSSQAPLKSWTEEPKEADDQLPHELLDNEDVQDENVNTLNMTDRNSNQINSEFKRKLESLKEVCKTGAKTRSPGLERRKRKRRKERRQRKRATPLPADSSSEEETDSTVRPKKRHVPIRFELYPLIKGR